MKMFLAPKDSKDFAEVVRRNLRAYRKKAGFSLRSVMDTLKAKRHLSFSFTALAWYETGAVMFDVRKLKILSKLYGIESVAYFLLEYPPDLSKEELTDRIIDER